MSNLFGTLWAAARQVPLSVGFSRQEFWSGLPFPPPGDLPDSGTEPMSLESPAKVAGFFITEPPGKWNSIIEINLLQVKKEDLSFFFSFFQILKLTKASIYKSYHLEVKMSPSDSVTYQLFSLHQAYWSHQGKKEANGYKLYESIKLNLY